MNFAEAAIKNAAFTRTENGAVALNTTGDARLDFFGMAGSLRSADKERITRLFSEAFKVDPLFATKTAFYARDVRGGLGERQTFRTILQFMAEYHPEALRPSESAGGKCNLPARKVDQDGRCIISEHQKARYSDRAEIRLLCI